jgi:hypothetical protein
MTLMGAQAQLEGIYPPGVRPQLTLQQAERAVPPTNTADIADIITELGQNVMPNQFQVAPIHAFAKERDDVLRKEWCL